jgi:hypothetical protein
MSRDLLGTLRRFVGAALLVLGPAGGLAAQEARPHGTKSPYIAQTLSSVGTAAPIALAISGSGDVRLLGAAGLVLGPTVGYAYAEELGRGVRRAATRFVILGASAGGAALICAEGDCSPGLFGGKEGGALLPAAMLLTSGLVPTTVLVVSDIGRVGNVARARNQTSEAWSLRPAFAPESGTVGLFVAVWL